MSLMTFMSGCMHVNFRALPILRDAARRVSKDGPPQKW
jgi:hypothetical protein